MIKSARTSDMIIIYDNWWVIFPLLTKRVISQLATHDSCILIPQIRVNYISPNTVVTNFHTAFSLGSTSSQPQLAIITVILSYWSYTGEIYLDSFTNGILLTRCYAPPPPFETFTSWKRGEVKYHMHRYAAIDTRTSKHDQTKITT